MTKQCSIAEARNQLPSLVHEVEQGGSVELTRRGRPVAVLLSTQEYERLRMPRLSLAEAIRAFREQPDFLPLDADEVFADVRDRSPGRDVEL